MEKDTEDHINEMKHGQSNILVAIRTRPLIQKEIEYNPNLMVKILDQKIVVLLDPSFENQEEHFLINN